MNETEILIIKGVFVLFRTLTTKMLQVSFKLLKNDVFKISKKKIEYKLQIIRNHINGIFA